MNTKTEALRTELLSDVESHGRRICIDHGLPADVAEQVAVAIADFLAEHWGGQNLNFPKDYRYKLAARDLAIYRRFRGDNYHELVKETGMTERGLRKLIARVHARELPRVQPRLFEDTTDSD
ncbi:MAG: hypothetical protein BSR46_01615 [Candidatus Dactylopiibacterium carminicum]|nr:MAG: hypothetical protein BSR46_01615 [Candidatus Dactylopiibacterium carminicum]